MLLLYAMEISGALGVTIKQHASSTKAAWPKRIASGQACLIFFQFEE
jgi:hypothetical protein